MQIKRAGYKSGKVVSNIRDSANVLTTNESSLYHTNKISFLFNLHALVELKFQ